MALRSLGSSLIARSSPGGKLRDIRERAMTTPQIPGKGEIGTISRQGLEEPMKREVPAGSEKIVGQQPIVESQAGLPADINPVDVAPAPIPETMPGSVAASIPEGARNQALFQGGVGTSNEQPRSGGQRTGTKQVSTGAPYVGYKPPTPEPTSSPSQGGKTQQKTQSQRGSSQYSPVSLVGSKVIAGESGADPRLVTLGQQIAGSVGKRVANIPGLRNVGNTMQTFGGQIAQGDIRGSIKAASKNTFSQLRSAVQNFFSKLRSKGK